MPFHVELLEFRLKRLDLDISEVYKLQQDMASNKLFMPQAMALFSIVEARIDRARIEALRIPRLIACGSWGRAQQIINKVDESMKFSKKTLRRISLKEDDFRMIEIAIMCES